MLKFNMFLLKNMVEKNKNEIEKILINYSNFANASNNDQHTCNRK